MTSLVLFSTVVFPGNIFSDAPGDRAGAGACVKKVRVTREQNPFRSMDAGAAHGRQAGKVRAVDPAAGGCGPVKALLPYAVHGNPLMFVLEDTGEAVVNAKYFSELCRVDATLIEPGRKKEIGRFLHASPSPALLRDIALFLLGSQIINTYWHVESQLCLAVETDSDDIYKASFSGIHKFYTNKYNEEKLNFSVTIDKRTGAIELLGGP